MAGRYTRASGPHPVALGRDPGKSGKQRRLMDLLEYQGKQLFAKHGVPVPDGKPASTVEAQIADDVLAPVGAMLGKLYEAFVGEDAVLVEVNPLLITKDRQVVALDSKVTIDDNALFRHPDTAEMRNPSAEDPQEQMAHERGLTYVKLDGNIGILGNGAGLVMSTLDVVAQAGGSPANFLDAGGGSKGEAITSAVEVILSNPNVKAVLFNIFGGITRCDEVARGLIEAFNQISPSVPFVVRLDGTNDEEGRQILADANLPNVHPAKTMDEAAAMVVELAKAGVA